MSGQKQEYAGVIAPPGLTYTRIGTGEARKLFTIALVEVSRPPGVSSAITRAGAPRACAPSIAEAMKSSTAGLMAPSTAIR